MSRHTPKKLEIVNHGGGKVCLVHCAEPHIIVCPNKSTIIVMKVHINTTHQNKRMFPKLTMSMVYVCQILSCLQSFFNDDAI